MTDFLTFAHELADRSGAIIRAYFGTELRVDQKTDDSPVSKADREAEAVIRALIEKTYPDHGIFGEEHGTSALDKRYVWVIDPIDGTRAFLAGSKEWGTLIALCDNGVPILGILDQPVTGERWAGVNGEQSLLNGVPITTRMNRDLAASGISSTSARYFTPPQASLFVKLADQCAEVIENGDCYAYGLLARGERDFVVDAGLKPYDILALVPIIQGAGGIITGWDNAPVTLTHFSNVVASANRDLHMEALKTLTSA